MANTKDIVRRIKSVNNTKKITRAMEMVAAVKMRRAVEAVLKTRSYADLSWSIILHLSKLAQNGRERSCLHPLLAKRREVKKVGIILITSNRGLCGGYNTAIINKAHESIMRHQKDKEIMTDFILIGKKGTAVYKYYNYNIAAEFPKADIASDAFEVRPAAKMATDGFLNHAYDKVMVAYTGYVSATKQIPRVKQLLPVDIEAEKKDQRSVKPGLPIGIIEKAQKEEAEADSGPKTQQLDYTFEPDPGEVLNDMIPRLLEVQLFQALLEANASEHSARMTAMHQANDAASDMIRELTLFYNKARQAAITSEIAEISAGANALA